MCRSSAHRADAKRLHAGLVCGDSRLAFLLVCTERHLRRHAERRNWSGRHELGLRSMQKSRFKLPVSQGRR